MYQRTTKLILTFRFIHIPRKFTDRSGWEIELNTGNPDNNKKNDDDEEDVESQEM